MNFLSIPTRIAITPKPVPPDVMMCLSFSGYTSSAWKRSRAAPDVGSAPSQKYWKVLYCTNVRSESSLISVVVEVEVASLVSCFVVQAATNKTTEKKLKKVFMNVWFGD